MLTNKYSRWYDSLIYRAQLRIRVTGEYYERHHILPRCLGGSNEKKNLCSLTAREHFICHWLLTKFTVGQARHKMIFAWHRLANGNSKQKSIKVTSRVYAYLKKEFSKAISEYHKGRTVVNKGVPMAERQKRKIAKAKMGGVGLKGKLNPMFGKIPWNKGIQHSEDTKQKQRDYATGRKVAQETRLQHSKSRIGKSLSPRPKVECKYCHRIVDIATVNRWHNENCKGKHL